MFEQEYHGVEGDSASCAEFYVLLSSLADVPLRQGIAVTGALNQQRNRRHLMLERTLVEAVEKTLFHIFTADHVREGVELLTGLPSGMMDKAGDYAPDTVLGRAQKTLQAYRLACEDFTNRQKEKTGRKRPHLS